MHRKDEYEKSFRIVTDEYEKEMLAKDMHISIVKDEHERELLAKDQLIEHLRKIIKEHKIGDM
jgi:hypothetical protein